MPESRETPRRSTLPRRFRRSDHLVAFWRQGTLFLSNFATRSTVTASPLVCAALDLCGGWTTPARIGAALGLSHAVATRLLGRMERATLVRRAGAPLDPRERAMAAFAAWNPAAGFFHSATRDLRFLSQRAANQFARRRASTSPVPPPVTRYRGTPRVDLPRPAAGAFADVLTKRRTWRRFSARPLDVGELATMLGLSLGVQEWVRSGGRDLPFKTSPSGGARHPIEGYVIVRKVTGLKSGLYHYAADRHLLERLGPAVSVARARRYFPHGACFAGAPVVLFLTAAFSRQLWRYPYARAYRAAYIEAGHVAQTWCLTATALGLAPFSLMGLADSAIERDLDLDGVSESVLYAAGAGRPPAGASWAPLPRGTLTRRRNTRL